MNDICLDIDVASLLQKQQAPAWIAPQLAGRRVWVTFVTVGELWKWAEGPQLGTARTSAPRAVAASRRHDALRYRPRQGAGAPRRWAQRRGRPRPQNDSWIAASCIRHDMPLLTLNLRDFEDYAAYDGLVLLRPSSA